MNEKIKKTFDQICAEEELKDRTRLFLEQRTRGYTRGKVRNYKYQISISAAVCLFFVLAGVYYLCFVPTAQISIDVNPSIELGVNRFDQVVSVYACNDDGQELADSLSIKFMDYEKALDQIMENTLVSDLLSKDEIMTIAVIGAEGKQCRRMLSQIESCTSDRGNAYCYFAQSSEVEKAHETGLSYGKYRAFLELQELDPDIKPEDIQGMTMREIRDLIQNLSQDGDGTQTESNRGSEHHGMGKRYGRKRNGKAGWLSKDSFQPG